MILQRIVPPCAVMILFFCCAFARAASTVRVAVLPFEIYSNVQTASLRETIARDLSQQLAGDKQIEVVDQKAVVATLSSPSPTFNEAMLMSISEKLGADFLVLGSMTKIAENLSLDTYIFHSRSEPPFFKDFTEGKNLPVLVREMAQKIGVQVLHMARSYQESQGSASQGTTVTFPAGVVEPVPAAKLPEKGLPGVPAATRTVEEGSEVAGSPAGEVAASRSRKVTEELMRGEETSVESAGAVVAAEERGEHPVREVPESGVATGTSKETTVAMIPKTIPGTDAEQQERASKRERRKTLSSSPFSSMQPIKISSKSMEADNKRNMVTFTGSVIAKQGDMVISSDTMRVAYESKGGIKRVEASGNVKMSQKNRIATGKKIVFYNPEQKIVMTGNPKIWQGDNLISCEKVTVLLKDDRIVFEGKVDSIIYPKTIHERGGEEKGKVEEISSPRVEVEAESDTVKKKAGFRGGR